MIYLLALAAGAFMAGYWRGRNVEVHRFGRHCTCNAFHEIANEAQPPMWHAFRLWSED